MVIICPICGREHTDYCWAGGACSYSCYKKQLWLRKAKLDPVIVNGMCYYPDDEKASGERGYDGRPFYWESLYTHKTYKSTNFWCIGEAPLGVPDNAIFKTSLS